MSIYYRVQSYKELQFKKNLHLKKRVRELVEILPKGYSFDNFLVAFKECYPTVWEDITDYCQEKKSDFIRRRQKGLRTVSYFNSEEYLKRNSQWKRSQNARLSEEERLIKYNSLVSKGQAKKKERDEKRVKNLERVQEVTPSYVKKLISAYFNIRKIDTLNVNARYIILLEASQFKSKETIQFLKRVASCDKNDELREIAYQSLVQLGERPWKARKRKGGPKKSQLNQVELKHNPTELLQLLYTNQHTLYQSYDVFLSHSSFDICELLELKKLLNRQNRTVYIDWIND